MPRLSWIAIILWIATAASPFALIAWSNRSRRSAPARAETAREGAISDSVPPLSEMGTELSDAELSEAEVDRMIAAMRRQQATRDYTYEKVPTPDELTVMSLRWFIHDRIDAAEDFDVWDSVDAIIDAVRSVVQHPAGGQR